MPGGFGILAIIVFLGLFCGGAAYVAVMGVEAVTGAVKKERFRFRMKVKIALAAVAAAAFCLFALASAASGI